LFQSMALILVSWWLTLRDLPRYRIGSLAVQGLLVDEKVAVVVPIGYLKAVMIRNWGAEVLTFRVL